MVLRIPKISVFTIFAIIPILYFNSCTFEFVKHLPFVLPMVLVCVLIWGLFLLRRGITVRLNKLIPMAVFALVLGALVLMGVQSQVEVLMSDLKNTIYILFFMLVFVVYSDDRYKNDRALIVFICITDIVISGIYSIYRLIEEPTLSRLLSTGSYHSTQAAENARGIVSFGVVYGLVLTLLVLFYLIMKKREYRLLNIILFSLFTAVLFFAQFLIAICLLGIGCSVIFLVNHFEDRKNNRTRFLCFLAILFICICMLPFVFGFILESDLFGDEINARLREILKFFRGENLDGTDLSVRFLQYFISLSAFTASYGMGKMVVNSVTVGIHSQWLDGLGNYGLLYILFIIALFLFHKFVLQIMPDKSSKQIYGIVFIIYVIMSLTNTSTWAPITLSLFVIVPFLCLDKVSE